MLPKQYRQSYDVSNMRLAHLPNATFILFAVCFSFFRILLCKPLTLAIFLSVFQAVGLPELGYAVAFYLMPEQ